MEASERRRRIPAVYVIVLGIDPGVANTGYGVVAQQRGRLFALDGGVIETSAALEARAAPGAIHERVGELIDEYQPDAVAVEDLYFGQNARVGVRRRAGARGGACSPPASATSRARRYTPQQVKAAVCGNGRAAKDQVQRMVQTLLSLTELPRPTTRPTRWRSRSATPTARR